MLIPLEELARLLELSRLKKREAETLMAAKWKATAMNERMLILHRIDGSSIYEVAINRVHIRSITTDAYGRAHIIFGDDASTMSVTETLEQVLAAMGEDIKMSLKLQEQRYIEYGIERRDQ